MNATALDGTAIAEPGSRLDGVLVSCQLFMPSSMGLQLLLQLLLLKQALLILLHLLELLQLLDLVLLLHLSLLLLELLLLHLDFLLMRLYRLPQIVDDHVLARQVILEYRNLLLQICASPKHPDQQLPLAQKVLLQ